MGKEQVPRCLGVLSLTWEALVLLVTLSDLWVLVDFQCISFLQTMKCIDLRGIHIITHSGKDRLFFIRWNVDVNSTYTCYVMATCNNQSTADTVKTLRWVTSCRCRTLLATGAFCCSCSGTLTVMSPVPRPSSSPQPSVSGRSWRSWARSAAPSSWVYPPRSPAWRASWSGSGWWCTAPSSGRSAAIAGQ